MFNAPKKRKKPEPLWRALLGHCVAAGYDFQLHKKSNPPGEDDEPVTIEFPRQGGT